MTDPSSPTPYDRLGGAPVLRAIADRFYDLMESDPAYADLRALHAPDLEPVRAGLASFLSGWTGGPRDWFTTEPRRCMMSLHVPIRITRQTADQWAEAMTRAIADVAPADEPTARLVADTLDRLARGMGR